AFAAVARWLQQSRIRLKQAMYLHRIVPRLSQRVGLYHPSPLGVEHGPVTVDLGQRLRLPVLDLEDQDSPVRVQDDKVGMSVTGANGDVVPAQVIVFQLVLKALREAPLA